MRRSIPALLMLLALVAAPNVALADDVYFTTKTLLKRFFKSSKRVTYVKVDAAKYGKELRRTLGYRPAKSTYAVFIAKTGDRVDGYAIIDEEMGQHMPITFGVKLDPNGNVVDMEVMVYREGYGDEIRERRFRGQFSGKGVRDPLAFGNDVVAVSGATISSKSMAVGVRRAVVLTSIARREAGTVAVRTR